MRTIPLMPIQQNKTKNQFHIALAGLGIIALGAVLHLAQKVSVLGGFYTAFLMAMPIGVFAVAYIGISSVIAGRKSYRLYHDKYSKWTLWLGLIISAITLVGCVLFLGAVIWGLNSIG